MQMNLLSYGGTPTRSQFLSEFRTASHTNTKHPISSVEVACFDTKSSDNVTAYSEIPFWKAYDEPVGS